MCTHYSPSCDRLVPVRIELEEVKDMQRAKCDTAAIIFILST